MATPTVSVMPHPWRTSMPYSSAYFAINAMGIADPPTSNRFRVENRSPFSSTCRISDSQMVGTPALTVTPSVSINSYRAAPSKRCPGRMSLAPAMGAA